jgi:biotin carboxylase
MHQEVAQAGLRIPKQTEISSIDEVTAWCSSELVNYPIVLKPIDGAGTQDVNFCKNEEEARLVIAQVVGKKNVFGHLNQRLIAQEFIDGDEYFVNAVTFSGTHFISDIWLYAKGRHNDRSFVYEKATLLEPTGIIQDLLKDYALKVLDALDFRTGASHMEIKVNSRGEVILIEVGARIAGAEFHMETRAATANRKSQLEYIIDASLSIIPENSQYSLDKGAVAIFLISTQEGKITAHHHLDEIKALPSFHRIRIADIGARLQKTVDLFTTPGSIRLVNANLEQLRSDVEAVNGLMQDGLFTVE